ncbi:MAG: DUF1257 domain-containing protein [Chloroflexota bacterium]|nr:DUF1257 domain-containing protein [Chloroflexota bacterium]
MSHFTRIKTKMVEKEFLLNALKDLGHPYQEDGSEVRGYGGRKTPAEIKIATSNPDYSIGFQKSGDSYEIIADWYGIRGLKQHQFVERLNQRYAYHATRARLEEQGFTLVEEENQKDGQIHLLVRRMA